MKILSKGNLSKIADSAFFKDSELAVGWPDGNKTAVYYAAQKNGKNMKNGKSIPAGKPVSLAMVARTLNYGREAGCTVSGHRYPAIPPRPFMDLASANFAKKADAILRRLLPRYISGQMTARQLFEFLGQKGVDEIKDSMRNGQWVALSPYTIANRRHGGDKPLIDTSTLVNSVSFEIRNK